MIGAEIIINVDVIAVLSLWGKENPWIKYIYHISKRNSISIIVWRHGRLFRYYF